MTSVWIPDFYERGPAFAALEAVAREQRLHARAVGDVERLSIGLYAVSSTMCVLLFEVLHDHILRLEHAIERAEQHHHSVHLQLEDGAPAAV